MTSLHVEIVQKRESCIEAKTIKQLVHAYLSSFMSLSPGTTISNSEFDDDSALKQDVQSITLCNLDDGHQILYISETVMIYHVYTLNSFDSEMETMHDPSSGEELPAANMWSLPSKEFYGLWESLIYDSRVKEQTLRFVETAFEFSDRGVDSNIINWNRVVLLHGPPGTGKTSLCRALSQKLSIRLQDRFQNTQLIEINSHSLFSKWFSESGKLVFKLFNKIKEIIEDPQILVCVLIDEVESLTHARRSALSGVEPSDSIRVVNAVLTQIDQIKNFPNVLILTTSNMTSAIDLAFVDRADIRQYVGPLTEKPIYTIFASCLTELMAKNIVMREQLFSYHVLKEYNFTKNESTEMSLELLKLARLSVGLSGRALRKLPFLAHALFIDSKTSTFSRFLQALRQAILKHKEDNKQLTQEQCTNHKSASSDVHVNGDVNGH
ncbi:Pachytene checkpoint protein 2 homolog [Eumeta japonica]|uniref:Pachytene checkpoint protein 2 homolog n=1 Tax=Eumeta variegata TaxID=151549 RepID=A0A4C1U9L2_EUMVA|nr:Pachytene checkpoint protein 2 homolog [Eumeta japonica]